MAFTANPHRQAGLGERSSPSQASRRGPAAEPGGTRFSRIEKAQAWLEAAQSCGTGSMPALCMTHGRILGPVERGSVIARRGAEEKGGIVIQEALDVARNWGLDPIVAAFARHGCLGIDYP